VSGASGTVPSRSLFGRPRAEVAAALPDREPVVCPLCRQPPAPLATDFQGLSLARCRRCGLQFHSPRPVLEQLATAVYGADYHRPDESVADARHQRHYAHQLSRLAEYLDSDRRRVLDVGCGAGAFMRFAQGAGWRVHGTDMVVTDAARTTGARVWELRGRTIRCRPVQPRAGTHPGSAARTALRERTGRAGGHPPRRGSECRGGQPLAQELAEPVGPEVKAMATLRGAAPSLVLYPGDVAPRRRGRWFRGCSLGDASDGPLRPVRGAHRTVSCRARNRSGRKSARPLCAGLFTSKRRRIV